MKSHEKCGALAYLEDPVGKPSATLVLLVGRLSVVGGRWANMVVRSMGQIAVGWVRSGWDEVGAASQTSPNLGLTLGSAALDMKNDHGASPILNVSGET